MEGINAQRFATRTFTNYATKSQSPLRVCVANPTEFATRILTGAGVIKKLKLNIIYIDILTIMDNSRSMAISFFNTEITIADKINIFHSYKELPEYPDIIKRLFDYGNANGLIRDLHLLNFLITYYKPETDENALNIDLNKLKI